MKSRSGNSTADKMRACGAGRFAPSPTGPLHLGSLLAATASYLDARAHGLAWQVRLDDLDQPRNQPGAERAILLALERHGLQWDGAVVRQSSRIAIYEAALATLAKQGLLFYCSCSRKDLGGRKVYPGTCRRHCQARPGATVRIRVDQTVVEFEDLLLGPQRDHLAETTGDFVVRRREGTIAYQLATAVDDGEPGVVRVIRGRDLLENTPRQIFLMERLGLAVPEYGHIPLITNSAAQKLSKQTGAQALDLDRPEQNLIRVLQILGVSGLDLPAGSPPGDRSGPIGQVACAGLLTESLRNWSLSKIRPEDVPTEP
jgi:glutamyl-Q tRNA(Asp) synthetase